MDDWKRILLVGLIVFVTHALEGITGFGCTVLALPLIAMLLGIKVAVPVLAVLAWILAGYIVLASWKKIVWKEYLFIVLHVGLGLPVGMILFKYLPETGLKGLLSLFMIGVGLFGINKTLKERIVEVAMESGREVKKNVLMRAVLFCGGIVHGAFVSGGPFVVIYASKALPDKSLFRVSLCLLWFTMNTIWMLQFTFFDRPGWTPEIGWILLITLPFLVTGMFFGDFLHHYVSEYYFRLIVYGVLGASGIVLVVDTAGHLLFQQ